jgi:hypothetical protein
VGWQRWEGRASEAKVELGVRGGPRASLIVRFRYKCEVRRTRARGSCSWCCEWNDGERKRLACRPAKLGEPYRGARRPGPITAAPNGKAASASAAVGRSQSAQAIPKDLGPHASKEGLRARLLRATSRWKGERRRERKQSAGRVGLFQAAAEHPKRAAARRETAAAVDFLRG